MKTKTRQVTMSEVFEQVIFQKHFPAQAACQANSLRRGQTGKCCLKEKSRNDSLPNSVCLFGQTGLLLPQQGLQCWPF